MYILEITVNEEYYEKTFADLEGLGNLFGDLVKKVYSDDLTFNIHRLVRYHKGSITPFNLELDYNGFRIYEKADKVPEEQLGGIQ